MSSHASAISKSYIELIPTITGITTEMRHQLTTIATHAANTLGDGFRQAAVSGVNDINHAFHSITLPTAAINTQMQAVATHSATALQQAIGGVHIPTQSINTQMQQVATHSATQMQQALGNVHVPPAGIAASTQTGAHTGMQNGLVNGIKEAGPKILAGLAALGIAEVFKKSMETAMDMEKGGAKMKASLGLTKGQSENANKVSKNLYAGNYGDSLDGVQEATTAAMSAFTNLKDGSSADLEAITKKALNMNSVFGVETGKSTRIASQLVTTGFAKDGTEAMDRLSASMQKVPVEVQGDMMDALDEYTPFMQQLGLAGEKGFGLLINGAAKGMYGIDKTGDALKEFHIRSTDMSASSKASYDAIGLDQSKMAGMILQGGSQASKAFDMVVNGLRNVKDPVAQQTAALGLFGTQLEDLGLAGIPKFLSSLAAAPAGLGDVAGAAKQLDDDLSNTAAGSLESFKRNLQVTFGEAAMPLVKELQPQLAKATQWITDNKAEISKWIHDIATAIGNVLVPAFQFLMPIVAGVTQFLNDNKEAIHQMMPAIVTVATVLGGLAFIGDIVAPIAGLVGMLWTAVPAFWAAATASTSFGISLLPLIALGAVVFAVGYAIGTFIYGLVTDFDGTMKWLGEAMAGVGFMLLSIGAMVANALIGIVNLVPLAINAMIMGVNGLTGLIGIPAIALIPTIPFIPLPAMATGGDIMGPTNVLAGEKEPETIVNRGKMNALMDDVINGKVGTGNGSTPPVTNYITIQKGVAEDDTTLAEKVALATAAATGAAWAQKRA